MPKNEWIIEDSPTPPASAEPTIKQQLAGIPVQAVRGTEDLFNLFTSLFGEPSMPGYQPEASLETPPQLSALSQLVQSGLGVPDEALESQNPLISGAQRFARGAPGAALSGLFGGAPGAIQNLAGLGLGSAVAGGAQAFGAPESLQDVLQAGTELTYGLKSGRLPTISKAKKTEDQLMRAAVKSGTQVSSDNIMNALKNVEERLGTEVSEKYATKIKHALGTIEQNFANEKINPVKAVDLRSKLYKLGNELPEHVSAEYINPLTKGINEFLTSYGIENPTFYSKLKARDKLTQLKNMQPVIASLVNKLQLSKVPGGQLATDAISKIVGEGERFIRGIAKNNTARKYYFGLAKSAAVNDPALVIKNINGLTKQMPELQETSEWVIED